MKKHISSPHSKSIKNYKEIEKKVRYCTGCDNKILSNDEFYKKEIDDLKISTTICGFCYNCKHHLLQSKFVLQRPFFEDSTKNVHPRAVTEFNAF
jgi:hypothetical protein